MPPGGAECPMLCLTKVFLFITTTLFILYLPLGDPQAMCDAKNVPSSQEGPISLCDVYEFMCRMTHQAMCSLEDLSCFVLDALYQGKLKIYAVLSKYDRLDFCKIGCGSDDEVDALPEKRPPCKCKQRGCRRK